MSRISVELIPRSREKLVNDAKIVRECLPKADTLNLPELLRMPLRSYEACSVTFPLFSRSIPHIRAIDVDPDQPLPTHDKPYIKEIVIIRGDPSPDIFTKFFSNTVNSVVQRYQLESPSVKIYAAFNPYRTSMRRELDTVKAKLDAGVQGFFTQPVFDLRVLELCIEWMGGIKVFWGLTSVTSARTRSYWESTNQVVFPRKFELTMSYNIDFNRRAISFIHTTGGHVHLMPIKTDLRTHLSELS